ncbi:MAG: hypothetical protein WC917_03950 [Bacilli bacterium]|jgi:hypothetical protein
MTKKETLKDWVKKWSIAQIVRGITSEGMMFMAKEAYTDKELKKYQAIMIKELKSRLK